MLVTPVKMIVLSKDVAIIATTISILPVHANLSCFLKLSVIGIC